VDFHTLTWVGNRLITGNDGGVFSTTDLGATWQSHNQALLTNMFYSAALHPTDPTFAFGSARDYGPATYRASEGWRVSTLGNWGESEVAISASRPDTDWMGTNTNLQIRRTKDGGRTNIQADVGIDRSGADFVAPVRKCPANDDVFLAGSNRLWRSNDFFSGSAPSWKQNSAIESSSVLSIAYVDGDRSCNTYVYGTRGGMVRMTRDAGTTWADLDPSKGLPSRPINGLAFDPSNPNRIFAAVSSYDAATPARPGHIFRTDNALSSSPTWTRVGPPEQPFADTAFNVIAIDPRNPQLVYAGSENGLWQSTDGGTNWTKIGLGQGLPPAAVYDIQISPGTNKTVIFTHGRGAYELIR
jgi:photosystem II stability/assembly factor-like uncharacterized protein